MYQFLWMNGILRYNVSLPVSRNCLSFFLAQFPLETTPWPTSGLRRVSVNSFGYGGSNAHCVLDDAFNYLKRRGIKGKHCTASTPPLSEHEETNHRLALGKSVSNGLTPNDHSEYASSKSPKVFVWSAADEEGVRRLAGIYEQHLSAKSISLEECADVYLNDLAYTLSNKRSSLPWKSYVVADSPESLREKLATCVAKPIRSSTAPTLSFIFTGQGAQWAGMGYGLVAYPVFEESLRRSEKSLQLLGCSWSIMGEHRSPLSHEIAYRMQIHSRKGQKTPKSIVPRLRNPCALHCRLRWSIFYQVGTFTPQPLLGILQERSPLLIVLEVCRKIRR